MQRKDNFQFRVKVGASLESFSRIVVLGYFGNERVGVARICSAGDFSVLVSLRGVQRLSFFRQNGFVLFNRVFLGLKMCIGYFDSTCFFFRVIEREVVFSRCRFFYQRGGLGGFRAFVWGILGFVFGMGFQFEVTDGQFGGADGGGVCDQFWLVLRGKVEVNRIRLLRQRIWERVYYLLIFGGNGEVGRLRLDFQVFLVGSFFFFSLSFLIGRFFAIIFQFYYFC